MPRSRTSSRSAPACARELIALLFGLAFATAAGASAMLDGLRWQARPLLVFAPDRDHAELPRQEAALDPYAADHRERVVQVIWVVGDAVQHGADVDAGAIGNASALRQRFGIDAAEFTVVLVGKDGGVKLRSAEPVDACTLHTLIDGMPMRRDQGGGPSRARTGP